MQVSVDELYEIKARFVELDLDNSMLLEEEELTDTGANLAVRKLWTLIPEHETLR